MAEGKLKMLKDALNAPTKPSVSEAIVNAARLQTPELIDEVQQNIDDYDKRVTVRSSLS